MTLFEIEKVKGSRFIGLAAPASSPAVVTDFLRATMAEYPDARHWCHGARLYAPGRDVDARSSDDGEPSGTAGRPIVAAIQGADLVDTAVVVVRYFGGTKLGTGGLIRAYGAAAQAVLREAERAGHIEDFVPTSRALMSFPHAETGTVRSVLGGFKDAVILEDTQEFGAAMASLQFTIPSEQYEKAAAQLSERTAARCEVSLVD